MALLAIGVAPVYADKESAGSGGVVAKLLDGKLVKPAKGGGFETFSIDGEKSPKYIAVYFSAHWCGPCRAFTPELVKFYDAAKRRKHDDFELIFVSLDTSEDAMHGYMTEEGMNFPALKYDERASASDIMKYAGPSIPRLVVLDSNGKVLADTFEGETFKGPQAPLGELGKLLKRDS